MVNSREAAHDTRRGFSGKMGFIGCRRRLSPHSPNLSVGKPPPPASTFSATLAHASSASLALRCPTTYPLSHMSAARSLRMLGSRRKSTTASRVNQTVVPGEGTIKIGACAEPKSHQARFGHG